jgi:hypothetical protein
VAAAAAVATTKLAAAAAAATTKLAAATHRRYTWTNAPRQSQKKSFDPNAHFSQNQTPKKFRP